ncbi:hypothetical protein MAR_036829 [Mya arenaria]|uniref:Uncharacterized protein n=1 Tax=Mya arenaria TaxID=6604 RepID=A0ABY7FM74_MYAAR|nr:hypothetical protein MAR_036829 [Mya arenaria]
MVVGALTLSSEVVTMVAGAVTASSGGQPMVTGEVTASSGRVTMVTGEETASSGVITMVTLEVTASSGRVTSNGDGSSTASSGGVTMVTGAITTSSGGGEGTKNSDPFRELFGKIGKVRSLCPGVPFLVLTATASKRTRQTIKKKLCMDLPVEIVECPDRVNTKLNVKVEKSS